MTILVGYQGEIGCYSEEAAIQYWGGNIKLTPHKTFEDVLSSLVHGDISHAILPIYNSIIGPIAACHQAMETYLGSSERIDSLPKISIPVKHALLCHKDSPLQEDDLSLISRIISHPAALLQCSNFITSLQKKYTSKDKSPTVIEFYDTAGAARFIQDKVWDVAIASERCAEVYGLRIIRRGIQDRTDNFTKFAILERSDIADISEITDHTLIGIRGAITIDEDTDQAISTATTELLSSILESNNLSKSDIISAVFTATSDIRAAFPAKHAREIGWNTVPMLCATEMEVNGALPMCIRVLLHVRKPSHHETVHHIYLRGARVLRPDISYSADNYILPKADLRSSIISL